VKRPPLDLLRLFALSLPPSSLRVVHLFTMQLELAQRFYSRSLVSPSLPDRYLLYGDLSVLRLFNIVPRLILLFISALPVFFLTLLLIVRISLCSVLSPWTVSDFCFFGV